MKSNRQEWMRLTTAILFAALLVAVVSRSSRAQSTDGQKGPETQQLKDRVKQLEQTVEELKEQIKTIENTQKKTGTAVRETVPAAASDGIASKPAAEAPPKPQEEKKGESTLTVYGHVMLDAGYEVHQSDPNWFDVARPTKLPSFTDEFAPNGKAFFSVRQTRFGVKSSTPTKYGELKTQFEFELFGTGVDAGQTTFRLRHAYGELGPFGAGQYWSPFMDIDVFPNSLEYWGPNGMVFFRNLQFRWMPYKGRNAVTIAIERPGASADQGRFEDRIELQGVKPKFDLPDLSGNVRFTRHWGYFQAAGMLRRIKWVDTTPNPQFLLSGQATGVGGSLSSNLKFSKNDVGKFEVVYGKGIENYMNDAPVDIGIARTNSTDPRRPIKGVALPMWSVVAFLDHSWNEKFSSSIGYSVLSIRNSEGQNANAFHRGHYALADLLYYPVENVIIGGEVQWVERENFLDGFKPHDLRVQFSFKYNFSKTFKF